MKIKLIIIISIFSCTFISCAGLIYQINGPKYKDKFDPLSYPIELESNYFEGIRRVKMMDGDDIKYYVYYKFDNDGYFYSYSSKEKRLTKLELDSLFTFKNWYIFENDRLKWEIYHDAFNGSNLHIGKIYTDSIIHWQMGNKRASINTYYKLK